MAPTTARQSSLADSLERRLPNWGPQLTVLVAMVINLSLPSRLTPFGPSWLLPTLEGILLVGLVGASLHPRGRHSPMRRRVALLLTAVVSAANMVSLGLLCHLLLQPANHHPINNGQALIESGAALWVTNVLLFGVWYWEIDRGGPAARRWGHETEPDFLFPQMTDPRFGGGDWCPGLIDYLYVSFTNATAFSPTDTMPLTQQAKGLMAAQALVALITVGLVVARAVNILG